MNNELSGPLRLLAAEAAVAVVVAVASRFELMYAVAFFVSVLLFLATALTLVTLFKRLAEQNIAQMPSQLLRAACWGAFFVVGLPVALWVAFMACCAPSLYFH